MTTALYLNRKYTDGYPDLEQLGTQWFSGSQPGLHDRNIESIIRCVSRMVNLERGPRTVCEVGCGPAPHNLAWLRERGFDAIGVEPIRAYVESARARLGDAQAVLPGSAEEIPLAAGSQRILLSESVLEHVESPRKAIAEAYRVLAPGGVLYIYTTNRWRFSVTGENGEFRIPFFNWLPDILKESYVHQQLHYRPEIANFTPRPAVHWFSFVELCKLGRDAGFAQFYSPLDLADRSDSYVRRGRLRGPLLDVVRRSPALRAMALLQFGSAIFMWKRG